MFSESINDVMDDDTHTHTHTHKQMFSESIDDVMDDEEDETESDLVVGQVC
jgi:hypothetical protein